MLHRLFLPALFAAALAAQIPPMPPICRPTPLDTFLGFDCNSPERQAIERNNAAHDRWRLQKEQRIFAVRGEIGEETQRSPLDPAALGLRYAEIESICREIDEREQQLVVLNRNALTDAQKTKLAALEAAMKLAPTGNEAISRRLIEGTPQFFFGVPVFRSGDFSSLLPTPIAIDRRSGACAGPPSNIIPVPRVTPMPGNEP